MRVRFVKPLDDIPMGAVIDMRREEAICYIRAGVCEPVNRLGRDRERMTAAPPQLETR